MVFLEDHDDGRAAKREIAFFFATHENRAVVCLRDGRDGEGTDFNEKGLSEIGEDKHGDFAVICREDVEILVERERIDGVVFAFHWPRYDKATVVWEMESMVIRRAEAADAERAAHEQFGKLCMLFAK